MLNPFQDKQYRSLLSLKTAAQGGKHIVLEATSCAWCNQALAPKQLSAELPAPNSHILYLLMILTKNKW